MSTTMFRLHKMGKPTRSGISNVFIICVAFITLILGYFTAKFCAVYFFGYEDDEAGEIVEKSPKEQLTAAAAILAYVNDNMPYIVSGKMTEDEVASFRRSTWWPAVSILRPISSKGLSASLSNGKFADVLKLGFVIYSMDSLNHFIESDKTLKKLDNTRNKGLRLTAETDQLIQKNKEFAEKTLKELYYLNFGKSVDVDFETALKLGYCYPLEDNCVLIISEYGDVQTLKHHNKDSRKNNSLKDVKFIAFDIVEYSNFQDYFLRLAQDATNEFEKELREIKAATPRNEVNNNSAEQDSQSEEETPLQSNSQVEPSSVVPETTVSKPNGEDDENKNKNNTTSSNSSNTFEPIPPGEEGINFLTKKAEHGDDLAQYELAMRYYLGKGTEKNLKESVRWLQKSAEQGNTYAQISLGSFYEEGTGVPQDIDKAISLYQIAADNENDLAQAILGSLYLEGTKIGKNPKEAIKWLEKAAENGNSDAQHNLANCYYTGNEVSQDYTKAFNLFLMAAKQGNVESQRMVGVCYMLEYGVDFDSVKAVEWFRKAATQGDSEAQYFLGLCYEEGDGVEKNIDEAVKWYKRAAEQGDSEAKDKLEQMNPQSKTKQ